PEDNTTNNTSIAPVRTTAGARLRARVTAPATTPIGERFPYEVAVTNLSRRDAQYVRLCAPPAANVTGVRAAGTFRYRRARCVNIRTLRSGRTASFTVTALPTAYG